MSLHLEGVLDAADQADDWRLAGRPPFMESMVFRQLKADIAAYTDGEIWGRSYLVAGHRGSVYAELFGDDVPDLAAARGRFAWEYLERVHGAISVGSNEVHRDGIAQAGLRLPRAKRK